MKLVEILAEEMEAWPEGISHLTQSSVDREIYDARDGKEEDSVDSLNPRFDTRRSHSEEKNYPIVTRAQWEAERDRQKGGEWKRHRGGKQPVAGDVRVEVKLRCGDIQQYEARAFAWPHTSCDVDANIMQYRVISQPQAEEPMKARFDGVKLEFSRDGVNFSEIGTARIDNICDFVSTEAKTDQIDGPIKWRDTIIELEAHAEDIQREIGSLHARLTEEGFSLIRQCPSVQQPELDVDMSDWRNWKDGDIVEVVFENDADLPIGKQCVVATIEKPDYIYGMPVSVYDEDANDGSFFWPEDITEEGSLVFKFIRRP